MSVMRLSRICFKVAGGRIHDTIILFVNDFVDSFGARTVAKCPQLDDFVNSFGGLPGISPPLVSPSAVAEPVPPGLCYVCGPMSWKGYRSRDPDCPLVACNVEHVDRMEMAWAEMKCRRRPFALSCWEPLAEPASAGSSLSLAPSLAPVAGPGDDASRSESVDGTPLSLAPSLAPVAGPGDDDGSISCSEPVGATPLPKRVRLGCGLFEAPSDFGFGNPGAEEPVSPGPVTPAALRAVVSEEVLTPAPVTPACLARQSVLAIPGPGCAGEAEFPWGFDDVFGAVPPDPPARSSLPARRPRPMAPRFLWSQEEFGEFDALLASRVVEPARPPSDCGDGSVEEELAAADEEVFVGSSSCTVS